MSEPKYYPLGTKGEFTATIQVTAERKSGATWNISKPFQGYVSDEVFQKLFREVEELDSAQLKPMADGDVPIFELKTSDSSVKIYANGWVEGWPENAPKLQGICNYIPLFLPREHMKQFSKLPSVERQEN